MASINREDVFAALKEIETIRVRLDIRHDEYDLSFWYMSWSKFRRTGMARLLEKRWGPRRKISKALRAEIMNILVMFAGSKKNYDMRSRKIVYARMMNALREKVPGMNAEVMEALAGAALAGATRKEWMVTGSLWFDPNWDLETLRAVTKFRRHRLPVMQIRSAEDIDRHIMRHLETLPLSNRKMVKRYVLQRRLYARYYDSPDALRALDASFKYTGSAYAFEKAAGYKQQVELALMMPEVFFKKAGQKVRERKYAGWLRDQFAAFVDIGHSVQRLSEERRAAIESWSALERHSRDWHAREVACAIDGSGYSDNPFEIAADIPRRMEIGGYTFTLLESGKAMAEEGAAMRHCLTSYIWRVENGNYLAFTVEGKGKGARATLGISRSKKQWVLDQVRGKRNALVPEELQAAAMAFSVSLNSAALPKAA